MRLSEFRYTAVLVVQLALLAVDLLFNTFIHRYLANTGVSVLLYVYTAVLVVQLALLAVDLLFNTFIHRYLANTGVSVLLYVLQDIGQLVAFAVLLITFFQTNIFQAGFFVLLFNEFRSTIIAGVGYFLLTLFVQAWTLANRFRGQVYFYWPDGLYVFFVIHKFASCLHYYLYKRTALSISDPKFYTDEWINNRIHQQSNQQSPKY